MAASETQNSIWDYVPLEEFRVPADTVQRTVSTRLAAFLQKLGRGENGHQPPSGGAEELLPLTSQQRHWAAPEPDWRDAAAALKPRVSQWTADSFSSPVTGLVSAPFAGSPQALAAVAEEKAWHVAAAPSPQHILDGGREWLEPLRRSASPWVIVQLEKCFLRHEKGLQLVRRLLAEAVAGHLGRGVIGCSSWAWAYLQNASAESEAVPVFTAQALEGQRLQRWIARNTYHRNENKDLHFRLPGQPENLLQPPGAPRDERNADAEPDRFFIHLAAHCRGIAGVAWSLWRDGLRKAEGHFRTKANRAGEDPAPGDAAQLFTVIPWDKRQLPSLPSLERPAGPFVLHALLIHSGLTQTVMRDLLPVASDRLTKALMHLRSSGVVARRNGHWYVTANGYPAVRSYLRGENYLTDPL